MEFNLVDLKIKVRFQKPDLLALNLSGHGGTFAASCKDAVCTRVSIACNLCPERNGCHWHAVFGQILSADPAALKRHQKPPLPFIFSFPFSSEQIGTTDTIECGLVVVGRAIHCIDMLLKGFAEFLKRDSADVTGEIIQVSASGYQGESTCLGDGTDIYHAANLQVLSAEVLQEWSPLDCSRIDIRLLSPLRFILNGRQCRRFDFSHFARSLMRRVSSLAYYYCDYSFNSDFKLLSGIADAVECIADNFCYESMNRPVSGITGSGGFVGELDELLPFLTLGRYLHAGKGAAYGMGRYELIL